MSSVGQSHDGVRLLFHLESAPSVEVFSQERRKTKFCQRLGGLFTKLAQSSGPENIAHGRPFPGHLAPGSVLSPRRITLENNGEFRLPSDRENAFAGALLHKSHEGFIS